MIKILSDDRVLTRSQIIQPTETELLRLPPIRHASPLANIIVQQTTIADIDIYQVDIQAHTSSRLILHGPLGNYFICSKKNTLTYKLMNHPLYERACNFIHVSELRFEIAIKAGQQYCASIIYFSFNLLQNLPPHPALTQFINTAQKDYRASLFDFNMPASTPVLITLQQLQHDNTVLAITKTARNLLHYLLDMSSEKHTYKKITQKQADQLYKVTQFIQLTIRNEKKLLPKDLKKQLEVDTILKQVHVSDYLIRNFFKPLYIYNLHDYINEQRILATIPLLHTKFTLKRIAETVGFTNRKTFNRLFYRFCGTEPAQYRQAKKR